VFEHEVLILLYNFDDFDFLCEIWKMFDENSDWIVIDFVLNLVKLFSILSTCGHFIFDPQTCFFRVFFRMLTTVFFWILDIKKSRQITEDN
jgi:hypothetical protein